MPDFSTLSITKDAFAELADCSFADSGRVLAARASVLRAGHVPGIDLFRGIACEPHGASVPYGLRLAVDRQRCTE
jgi:hypothetical protein